MRSLDLARATCESYLPGLLDQLGTLPLAELEAPDAPGIALFRAARGPALVIPTEYGGIGAGPVDAVRVQRAIGSVSPSLAVATTMHHFSVATVFTLADSVRNSGLEWALLEVIANNNLLVASGFAEGRAGQGILSPSMTARKVEGGYVVNGAKKPCSLSRSMDLLTAAIRVDGELPGQTAERLAFLLMPATLDGLSRHPFWTSRVLAGAESDEVRLTDVFVEDQLVMHTEPGDAAGMDDLQTLGFIWFQLLIAASYLGTASALVERALDGRRGPVAVRAAMGTRLETAAQLLEGAAHRLADGVPEKEGNSALADSLVARYGAQDAIGDAARTAVELLGGMAFIRDDDVSYLAAAHQALGFHPPSRSSTDASLVDWLEGTGPVLVP